MRGEAATMLISGLVFNASNVAVFIVIGDYTLNSVYDLPPDIQIQWITNIF